MVVTARFADAAGSFVTSRPYSPRPPSPLPLLRDVADHRRAGRPRTVFVRTTIVLTALSLVPDVLVDASAATKMLLMLTHVV
ncbi:DUF6069 family protein, partial [Nonomuraea deserti]